MFTTLEKQTIDFLKKGSRDRSRDLHKTFVASPKYTGKYLNLPTAEYIRK